MIAVTITSNVRKKVLTTLLLIVGIVTSGFSDPASDNSGDETFQEFKISGRVSDANNDPLPGVSIMIKGTAKGTTTDFDGRYSLFVPDKSAVLVFSFIGYQPQEVQVSTQSEINVKLEDDLTELEELIVIGYGEQKKETLTGAVESVSSEVFESRAVSNPALALQGQTPGVAVTRTSARPGDDPSISIRGTNSINGNSNPLVIIDGIPTLGMSAFTSLNPDDIESISVLKDGSAAIYGSRASNGVLLVTTKKGKGEIKVNVNIQGSMNTPSMRAPLAASPQEYANAWLRYGEQDKLAGLDTYYWAWTEDQLNWMAKGEPGYLETPYWGNIYVGNNLKQEDLYGTSFSQRHDASVSGGTDRSSYRFSFGYVDEVGPVKPVKDALKRYNFRGNYKFQVNEWLDLSANVSYFNRTISGPTYDGFRAFQEIPLFPTTNPFGNWGANFGQAGGGVNRLAEMVDGGRRNKERQEFRTMLSATAKILPGLTFRADAALDRSWDRNQEYRSEVTTYAWNNTVANARINTNNNYISESSNTDRHETYQGVFNYEKSYNNHSFNVTAGGTAEKRVHDKLGAKLYDFEDLGVYDLEMGSVENQFEVNGGGSNWGLMSLLGRFNYGYKNKYLIELQARRDGSSKFADGYKWKTFAGGSLGWVITQEDFLKNNDILSFLKLKASYGELGNQGGIGNHDYASLVNRSSFTYFGNQSVYPYLTATANDITTNERSWETIKSSNIGLEFGFLNDKLKGEFNYYQMLNEDMLIGVTYPSILGGSPKTTNSGTLETKGWEFQISWNDKIGSDFSYNIGFNLSDSKNKLVSMEGKTDVAEGLVGQREGYPLNSYFMYQTDGFFATQAEADAYYELYGTVKPGRLPQANPLRAGDARIVDTDGNGYIDAIGDPENGDAGDLVYVGDQTPHFLFGINAGFQWKGFDFNMFWQGVLEQKIYRNEGQAVFPRSGHFTNQNVSYVGHTWTPDNTGAPYPRVTSWQDINDWNYRNTDFMLSSGRYIRLKTLSLGYTFNTGKIKGVDKVRVYFSGNDLLTFSNEILDGWDPEYGNSLDQTYPFYRSFALGANLSF
ncbi:SusC/RagA family TonB-linked outer membrane protein [Flammeovirga aprica]|uniref:TonB-dependent receptor n=1 Tax=Flammeovirga aprica JL-4 TaxID=694437 RepID=A0A7X9RU71_9BACT|nr:TonB-dependent receptor [Flammeovirga aprica]NME68784.1 TonB-dependent receptor [Flammeovirga aprica JL-4]